MWLSVDSALRGLFDIAARRPLSVKTIFFSEKGKIDCRAINVTVNYNASRIPSEQIMLARNTLARCYAELEQMEALFFLY